MAVIQKVGIEVLDIGSSKWNREEEILRKTKKSLEKLLSFRSLWFRVHENAKYRDYGSVNGTGKMYALIN